MASTLPDYAVLDPEIDRLPVEALRALQAGRLTATVRYVYETTTFWRRMLDEHGVSPDEVRELADVERLPFCTKDELLADQAEHPPFGSYLAADRTRLVRFMTTSGTTGQPLRRVFTARDWGYVLDRLQRNSPAAAGDVAVMLGPIDGLLGPMASAESAARAGVLVVLAGLYDSKTKVRLLSELRPSVVSGAASYLLHLVEVAREEGVDLRALGIRTVISAGEPGAAVEATRRRLVEGWGAFVRDGYGMTELFPLGGGCRHSAAIHIASDLVITEIVDHESGRPAPAGEPGEVVYTNIVGDSQPLLRYRSGDVARLATGGACACGFTGARLLNGIEGRVDDMLWVRGMNVFPSAIEAVVYGFEALGDEYEIVVEGGRALATLRIRTERKPGTPEDAAVDLEREIRRALAGAIRAEAEVEVLPYGTLPRGDGRRKRRRVIDRRSERPAP
jgi:phenylacetate-CoA ligase